MFNCISAQKFTAQQIIFLEFISLLFQEKSPSNPEKFHHFMTIAKEHHSAPLCSRQQGLVFNNTVFSTKDPFEFNPTNYSKYMYISTDLHCVFFSLTGFEINQNYKPSREIIPLTFNSSSSYLGSYLVHARSFYVCCGSSSCAYKKYQPIC